MKKSLFIIAIILTGVLFKTPVFAFQIQSVPGVSAVGDFVMGPGKTEIFISPGEKVSKELSITNRSGQEMNFKIEIEDFTGSKDLNSVLTLLGSKKGPYSLRDYIHPEVMEFKLGHAERITLPVSIEIPLDADPGGRYGAVIVSTDSSIGSQGEENSGQTKIKTVSRLGSLFFVRVKGEAKESGRLNEFRIKKNQTFFEEGPVSFELLFENTGNVHLSPSGVINITNILGRKVGEITMDSWFVMPGSTRLREVEWDRKRLFGRYEATVDINMGYKNDIDSRTVYFWVIPWKLLSLVAVGATLFIYLAIKLGSKFEIQIKRKG